MALRATPVPPEHRVDTPPHEASDSASQTSQATLTLEAIHACLQARSVDEGYSGECVAAALQNKGAGVRALLAYETARGLGLDEARAVFWGAACEALHTASLIHDDIQDETRHRRGAHALWVRFGVNRSLTAGDRLIAAAFALASDAGTAAPALVAEAMAAMSRGQGEELSDRPMCSGRAFSDWLAMAEAKTGAMSALPVTGALALGGAEATHLRISRHVGEAVGVAYQISDDWGDVLSGQDVPRIHANAFLSAWYDATAEQDRAALMSAMPEVRENRRLARLWGERISRDASIQRVFDKAEGLLRDARSHLAALPEPAAEAYDVQIERIEARLNDARA